MIYAIHVYAYHCEVDGILSSGWNASAARSLFGISAARFGDLEPFGRFFEPFGAQYFDLAILKFGSFLGSFLKIVKKTCLNRFLTKILELWCRYFWLLGGLWCRSFEILKLLWCRSFEVFKNLAIFCSNFLAALRVSSILRAISWITSKNIFVQWPWGFYQYCTS